MRIAIIGRLEKIEGNGPFSIRYYLSNFYKEIFDKLDVLLIPVVSEKKLEEVCSLCDGLILTGSGNHVNPKYYNQKPIKEVDYDKFDEYPLVKKAVEIFNQNNKPILGICAGIQELNVIFGGTLNQSIPKHQTINIPKKHKIQIKSNSFLYSVYNKECIEVNSFHSQSIKDVAPNFTVTAVSQDGVIEGIENGNIIGVQWHPEKMYDIEFFDKFLKTFNGENIENKNKIVIFD